MQRLHKKDSSFSEIHLVAVNKCPVPQTTHKILQTVKKKMVGKNPAPHLAYYSQQTEILLLAELFLSR